MCDCLVCRLEARVDFLVSEHKKLTEENRSLVDEIGKERIADELVKFDNNNNHVKALQWQIDQLVAENNALTNDLNYQKNATEDAWSKFREVRENWGKVGTAEFKALNEKVARLTEDNKNLSRELSLQKMATTGAWSEYHELEDNLSRQIECLSTDNEILRKALATIGSITQVAEQL